MELTMIFSILVYIGYVVSAAAIIALVLELFMKEEEEE